jgi:hypothetical protein
MWTLGYSIIVQILPPVGRQNDGLGRAVVKIGRYRESKFAEILSFRLRSGQALRWSSE